MRAIRYHRYGDPDVLQLEDAPVPVATTGTVRVRTLAAGVNPIDWKLRRGDVRHVLHLDFPVIPGRDAVGVVDQVGPDVYGTAVGDLVFGSGGIGDTYAEHVVLTAWAPAPATWSTEQAASAALAATTALRALDALQLHEGDALLIEGATGAVGQAAAAFALDRGITVIGTGRPDNLATLEDAGVIAVPYGGQLAEAVSRVAPKGVAAAIDTAGSGSLADLVRIVGRAMAVVTVTDPARARALGTKSVDGHNSSALLEVAADLGSRGGYTPRVGEVMPLAAAARAHRVAEAGYHGGKLVLTIA